MSPRKVAIALTFIASTSCRSGEVDGAHAERRDTRVHVTGTPMQLPLPRAHRATIANGTVTIEPLVGDQFVAPASLSTQRVSRGALEVQGEQRLEDRDIGVEQSWRFDAVPAGSGDLVVRVSVEGYRFVSEDERGLHFAARDGRAGIRYGHGTWIDATGREERVLARWIDGAVELRVRTEMLASSQFPAVLDPTISAETPTDAVEYTTPDSGSSVAGAFGGGLWLTAYLQGQKLRITRFKSDATLLDRPGVEVASGPYLYAPDVAFDGTRFFVVYEDSGDIKGRFVGVDGALGASVTICAAAGGQGEPHVAYAAGQFLVAWSDKRSSPQRIYRGRVATDGTLLDGDGVAVPLTLPSATQQARVTVASDGTDFMLAWNEYAGTTSDDVYAARVSASNAITTTIAAAASTTYHEDRPKLSWDGSSMYTCSRIRTTGTAAARNTACARHG